MEERYSDITAMNHMQLVVPADGTLAVVADGSNYWAPFEGLEVHTDLVVNNERVVAMNFEPVLSMDGKLVDIVAWQEEDPSRWWVATGMGVCLGAPELMRVSFTDLPCVLVSTPAGWRHLQRSPQGVQSICILNWSTVDTLDLFAVTWGTILCTSDTIRRRLEDRHKELGGDLLLTAVCDPLDYSGLGAQ